MYKAFFGLSENPFSLTPDPRCLFLSRYHEESIAHLMYGFTEGGGFVMLTGEVGTGKTTLCRYLLERIPEDADVALILNPKQSAVELLANVCDELLIDFNKEQAPTLKTFVDILNARLIQNHAAGRRTVLIMDEAQALSFDVLEQIRLLTNLETTTSKLLHIILIGQPELKTILSRHDLRQLDQRISARYHLEPLNMDETARYVRHRMAVARPRRQEAETPLTPGVALPVFTNTALRLVYLASGGIPRVINKICDRALLGAYVEDRTIVTVWIVGNAVKEVTGRRWRPLSWLPLRRPIPSPVDTPIISHPPARRALRYALLALSLLAALVLIINAAINRERPPAVADAHTRERAADATASHPLPKPVVNDAATSVKPSATRAEGYDAAKNAMRIFFAHPAPLADGEAALRRLALMWDIKYTDDGSPVCVRAGSFGLECFSARGSWNDLKSFSLRAVITLTDPRGGRHPALVTHLDEARVGLSASVPVGIFKTADVSRFWNGEFTILWKKPDALESALIAPGSRGRDVVWLRDMLDAITGSQPAEGDPELFDEALGSRVTAFQRSRHVRADGIAGPVTLILITAALKETAAPFLKKI